MGAAKDLGEKTGLGSLAPVRSPQYSTLWIFWVQRALQMQKKRQNVLQKHKKELQGQTYKKALGSSTLHKPICSHSKKLELER